MLKDVIGKACREIPGEMVFLILVIIRFSHEI